MGKMALITVTGRRTGQPRTTPVSLAPMERGWRLIAPFGEVDWVKNLRAAGTCTITRRRRDVDARAVELTGEEAASLLRESLLEVGPIVRAVVGRHFDLSPRAPLEHWLLEVPRHPVFRLELLEGSANRSQRHRDGVEGGVA
jgi:deazaflavin-dependent oxidoreductase (nitroreductase family)